MPGSGPRSPRSPSGRCGASSISRPRSTPASRCSKGLDARVIDHCHERARPRSRPARAALVRTMARERRLLPARLGRLQPLRRPRSPPRSASTRRVANELDVEDGRLAGTVGKPIVGAEGKRQALLDAAARPPDPARRDARGRRRRQRHSDARGGRPRHRLSRQAGASRPPPTRGSRRTTSPPCSTRRAMRAKEWVEQDSRPPGRLMSAAMAASAKATERSPQAKPMRDAVVGEAARPRPTIAPASG